MPVVQLVAKPALGTLPSLAHSAGFGMPVVAQPAEKPALDMLPSPAHSAGVGISVVVLPAEKPALDILPSPAHSAGVGMPVVALSAERPGFDTILYYYSSPVHWTGADKPVQLAAKLTVDTSPHFLPIHSHLNCKYRPDSQAAHSSSHSQPEASDSDYPIRCNYLADKATVAAVEAVVGHTLATATLEVLETEEVVVRTSAAGIVELVRDVR